MSTKGAAEALAANITHRAVSKESNGAPSDVTALLEK